MFNKLFIISMLFIPAISTAMNEQTIIHTLQQTNNINEQDKDGNTIAHLLPAINNRNNLITIFNLFITKGLDSSLKNHLGQTAKQVALEKYKKYNDISFKNYPDKQSIQNRYASNANLFDRLENGLGHNPEDRFILEKDEDTITYKYGNL